MANGEDRAKDNTASHDYVSLVIAVVLLFLFAIAAYTLLAKVFDIVTGRAPPAQAEPLSASAWLLRGATIGNGTGQSLLFSINTTSHYNATLRLVEVVVNVTTANGLSTSIVLTPRSPSNATVLSASLVNLTQLTLAPGGSQVLYVNLTAPVCDPATSVGFKLVFIAPNGEVVIAHTNTTSVAIIIL